MHKERTMGVLSDQFINIPFRMPSFTRPLTMMRTTSPVLPEWKFPDDTGAGWFQETPDNVIDFTLSLSEFAVDREGAVMSPA